MENIDLIKNEIKETFRGKDYSLTSILNEVKKKATIPFSAQKSLAKTIIFELNSNIFDTPAPVNEAEEEEEVEVETTEEPAEEEEVTDEEEVTEEPAEEEETEEPEEEETEEPAEEETEEVSFEEDDDDDESQKIPSFQEFIENDEYSEFRSNSFVKTLDDFEDNDDDVATETSTDEFDDMGMSDVEDTPGAPVDFDEPDTSDESFDEFPEETDETPDEEFAEETSEEETTDEGDELNLD